LLVGHQLLQAGDALAHLGVAGDALAHLGVFGPAEVKLAEVLASVEPLATPRAPATPWRPSSPWRYWPCSAGAKRHTAIASFGHTTTIVTALTSEREPGRRSGLESRLSTKKTAGGSCLSLGANRWMREGILKAGAHRRGCWQWAYHGGRTASISYDADLQNPDHAFVTLEYSKGGGSLDQPQSLRYPIELASTVPRFGGLRWWFVCPLVVRGRPCRRRVGKLYLPGGARYFGCWGCHGLAYTSSQEAHKGDALLGRIAADVGCSLRDVKRALSRRLSPS
jgi:hypothetical protein